MFRFGGPQRRPRMGIQALFVEKDDSRPERQEHERDASGDSETGGKRGRAIVASAGPDVGRHRDQQFKDTPLQQPRQIELIIFSTLASCGRSQQWSARAAGAALAAPDWPR